MRLITQILLATALLIIGIPSLAMQLDSPVGWQRDTEGSPDLAVYQQGCMTLDQAVQQVRRQYNGRIVSAETQVSGGREVHVIKVLTSDGKVKTVRIPGCRV